MYVDFLPPPNKMGIKSLKALAKHKSGKIFYNFKKLTFN